MLRHIDILQGVQFKWLTDHKGLIYLLNQKNLSGRQAWWLEKISSFTFEVVYIAGSENVVADALSRIYSNDSAGTIRASSEFSYHDVSDDDTTHGERLTARDNLPVLAGIEARIATRRGSRDRRHLIHETLKHRLLPKRSLRRRKVGSLSGVPDLQTNRRRVGAYTMSHIKQQHR